MPTFDLAAKIVTKQQRAWVVHAGRSQQHSSEFIKEGIVFLETPNLNLRDVKLGDKKDVRRALRRSVALSKHIRTTGSQRPSNDLQDYNGDTFEDSAQTALAGGIARMFGRMKAGDIVMSPGHIPGVEFNTPIVHFGEIVGAFDADKAYRGSREKTEFVPFRRVNWLTSVPRKNISIYLERKIGKPPALREIAVERDTEEILQHTYKSYVFENTSSSLIEASRYDGSDFVTLTNSQYLIAVLVAAHHAFTSGSVADEISDVESFVKEHFKNAPVENIVIDFASPGFWRLVGGTSSMAAFVALGITILCSDLDMRTLATDLTVTNSISTPGQAEFETQENMKDFLRSIDNLDLERLRERAREGSEKIGLSSSVQYVAP